MFKPNFIAWLFILAFVTLVVGGETAAGQELEPLILTPEQSQYPVGRHLEILEDRAGALTINDVTSPDVASQFVPSQSMNPGVGFTDSVYWVRFTVRNATQSVAWLVALEWPLFFIDYYAPSDDTMGYEVIHTGSALPFATRAIPSSKFAFQLSAPFQETQTIYIRAKSAGSLAFPITIWNADAFVQHQIRQSALNSFFYGIFAILALYHLILFFRMRDTSYLYYSIFLGTTVVALMALDGFGAQYLWSQHGGFNAVSPRLFVVVSSIFAFAFADTFLRAEEYAPRLHMVMIGVVIASIVCLALQFVSFRVTAMLNAALLVIGSLSAFLAAYRALQHRYAPAKHYLVGWSLYFFSVVLFMLTLADIIPTTFAPYHLLRTGLLVLAFALSFALAARVDLYRQEAQTAQLTIINQRKHIAQDLHDSVTQSLYSANLFAEAGHEVVQTGDIESASYYFQRIGTVTQHAMREMRLFLYELRPPDVVNVGLVDALQRRLDAVESRSGMTARLIVGDDVAFPDGVNDQLFRIGQEALNNVIKHAFADVVTIRLYSNGKTCMEISDDGCGFDLDEARLKGGFGISSMADRASQIGAKLHIESAPGAGTVLRVELGG